MPYDDPDDHRPTCTFSGEELEVTFIGKAVRTDYGVPGSPVWDEIEDIEISSLTILSIPVDPKVLPVALQTAIIELSDDLEWESV